MIVRRTKAPRWTAQEIAILDDVYPSEGLTGCADLLPERSWQSIYVMASKRGLRTDALPPAPKPKLSGAALEQAIRLREDENWSFERIGAHFGVSESAASNAVLIALCPRRGFVPADRDDRGCLTPLGAKRVREMIELGRKAVDIQIECGVSASCVAEQRRRIARIRARCGQRPLPPPGNGEQYSGARISDFKIARVEAMFLDGFGSRRIQATTGVTQTTITRLRASLIARLTAEGKTLPGCDAAGVRRVQRDHPAHHSPEKRAKFGALLLTGVPVYAAAEAAGISRCAGYAMAKAVRAEAVEAQRIEQARLRARPRTFAETLALVAQGRGLVPSFVPSRAAPAMTLGGVSAGML